MNMNIPIPLKMFRSVKLNRSPCGFVSDDEEDDDDDSPYGFSCYDDLSFGEGDGSNEPPPYLLQS